MKHVCATSDSLIISVLEWRKYSGLHSTPAPSAHAARRSQSWAGVTTATSAMPTYAATNGAYVSAHPIDHNLVLIRTPAPEPVDAVIAVVEKQKWVVNSIMDRYPIKKGKGVKGPRRYMYHVQWEGKGLTPTWETAEAMNNPKLIERYNLQFEKGRKKRLRDESR
jgi:hypothetical protein